MNSNIDSTLEDFELPKIEPNKSAKPQLHISEAVCVNCE